ncbi:MAG: HD domain-containing phosphohydrolase [Thermodesulfovibrionales bacterium]|nr:HD domain-containing phosphohydrolase [Thermodesulfovibrionales bacterium]
MESSRINNRPIYNSRLINTYIKLIKAKYSYINVDELLSYAKIEPYQVEDEGHWFIQEQIDLFYERLSKLIGNKDIAREAGRYAASPDAIGVMRQYALGLVGPAKAYELVGKYASNFTKSAIYESKRIASTKVEIVVTPVEGVEEKPFQCENRMGYWEAIALIFNYRLPKIEHPECLFKGGKVCRYIVSWQESRAFFWKKVRNYATLFLSAICLGFYPISSGITLSVILPFSVFAVLLLTLYAVTLEKQELSTAIDNLRDSTEQLAEQINVNYNNILMINEIGLALSRQTDIDGILKKVMHVLEKRLDYNRGATFLADEEKKHLIFRAGFGYTDEQLSILKDTDFHLDRPESKGVFAVSFREQKPFLINNLDEIKDDLSPRSLDFAKKMGVKSFICCPIIYEEASLGILAVDNIKTKRPLVQSDINLLMGIAPEIGISIRNAMVLEAKERQFKSLLQVLASSIDARDPLTAGHSEKVTEYTVGICKEMGMSKEYCEVMRVAALLHDYGKIGVRDSILKKEGRLSVEEHEEIKAHVEKTKMILEQINFEGIYKEIPDIAGSHHEKFDGSGYPKGLRGDEIPLGARILAVADFFEAITSKRHYRDPMPLDLAFKLLRIGSGTDFDEDVVEAFIRYYKKEYDRVAERKVLKH